MFTFFNEQQLPGTITWIEEKGFSCDTCALVFRKSFSCSYFIKRIIECFECRVFNSYNNTVNAVRRINLTFEKVFYINLNNIQCGYWKFSEKVDRKMTFELLLTSRIFYFHYLGITKLMNNRRKFDKSFKQ